MKSADEMAERDLVSYASSSSTDGGYESSEKTSCIPKKFLNSLGFIDYGHYGEYPWTTEEEEEIVLPPDYTLITDLLAIDCEMVGVGEYKVSALGRVSIVNEYGYCVYDTFVNPREQVTDYRTEFSGIRADDLFNAADVEIVLEEVSEIVHAKVLVGHSIYNDLEVLKLSNHPRNLIRDTAIYFKKDQRMKGVPSLKDLAFKFLGLKIQTEEHSSIHDAQATLKLYLINRDSWEHDFAKGREDANLAADYHCVTNTAPDKISDMHVEPRESDLFVDSKTVFLRQNKVIGAYSSCGEYLDVQFRLLLEDFLRPLRDCVKNVHQWRQFKKNSLFHNVQIRIGENTEFELKKLGRLLIPIERNNLEDVDWEETKMFLNGSLLLLTQDDFKSVKLAVIKFRPEEQTNPYFLALHVEFSKHGPSWTVDQNYNRFLMMESTAFYEAYKHSLKYLQTVNLNKFPLKKYIVDAITISQPPSYFLSPTNKLDFSVLTSSSGYNPFSFCQKKAAPLDFHNWPNANQLNLDESQFEALQRALTQEMTIIQGPPGTGKTFIGVQIVKLLLSNPWLLNSPILIVSYTNHALDQTLEQILHFVTNKLCGGNERKAHQTILRIGGGSKSEIIQPLVLRQKIESYVEKRKIPKKLDSLIEILHPVKDFRFHDLLLEQGILDFQKLSKVILDQLSNGDQTKTFFDLWKSWQQEMRRDPISWFGLQKRETTYPDYKNIFILDFNKTFDASSFYQSLSKIPINSVKFSALDEQFQLNTDRNKILKIRWTCYLFLVKSLKNIVEELQQKMVTLQNEAIKLEYCLSENMSIRSAQVIGMTTTGAVKHKYIVHMTKPKIMIVEEAAHVLEAHVVASLTEHCQQMIMIGDHKQLRPLTADNNLATNYKLDISLMERLVKNGVDQGNRNWTQLKVQHRMRPEIARLVCPVIYEELHNHYDVHKYPDVKGCSKNLFFIDHRNKEEKEQGSRSYCNLYEVNFLCGLVKYFVNGGFYEPNQITVIVAYLAQKVLIENKLKNLLMCSEVRISTVDGYQGEENDVILLSLVRNNRNNNVGFLKTDNRVCVALSRARHGLFMIGNMSSLKAESETWSKINDILVEMGSIGSSLPLTSPGFKVEPLKIFACGHKYPIEHMNSSNEVKCMTLMWKRMSCGHRQNVPCHQKEDDKTFPCYKKKFKQLPCGHRQQVDCFLPPSVVNCTQFISKDLPCGHWIRSFCHQSVLNIKCNVAVYPCRHQRKVPCHQSHLVECDVLVKKKLTCGHFGDVACSEDVPDLECDLMATSTLDCGHFQAYRCHLRSQVKCLREVIKTLPCGHEQTTACHSNPADVLCKSLVPSNCSHEVLVNCIDARDGAAVCVRKCDHIFNCGHRCPYLCHENDKSKHVTYQCQKICERKCPNGHRCFERHECFKFCPVTSIGASKCERIVGHCSSHGEIECHRTKDGDFSCPAECDRIFNCGHQCRYLCHENDNPNHVQYKCTERCERLCPNGHSCSEDHECYLNCPVKSGHCTDCYLLYFH